MNRYGSCDRCGDDAHTIYCVGAPPNLEQWQNVEIRGIHLCPSCYRNHRGDPNVQAQMTAIVFDADTEPVYSLPDPEPTVEVEQEEQKPWWKFW